MYVITVFVNQIQKQHLAVLSKVTRPGQGYLKLRPVCVIGMVLYLAEAIYRTQFVTLFQMFTLEIHLNIDRTTQRQSQ